LVGKTRNDGFGYSLRLRQSQATPDNVAKAADAIKRLRDVPGFIVDLRRANGGAEPLALNIATLFCPAETIYAKSKYRNGPRPDDFADAYERTLPASEGAYTKPVVCLIGPGAISSGEAFVQMMHCLPHVTTVGLPTRGASGNPKPFALKGTGLVVMYSRWIDLMPDGQAFEGSGIPPDVTVDEPTTAYSKADPTLEKGMAILREKARRPEGGKDRPQ
jgi:C-terminal processing protease CtpA/Prc